MRLPFSNIHSHYYYYYYYSHNPSPHVLHFPLPFNLSVQLSARRPPPPPQGVRMMDSSSSSSSRSVSSAAADLRDRRDKIVVIMGATGCGKSRLSIDLATRFGSEIINSDKMQVYRGLDITTNKITVPDCRGVRHHLLGEVDPEDGEFTRSDFRLAGDLAISDIVSRQKLPMVAGGSNSFIHALLVDRFDPHVDVYDIGSGIPNPISTQLRYNCCFIWVDVAFPVLCDYLCKRVDEMLNGGMFEELSEFYFSAGQPGLRKAIGVPEFDPYFKKYPPGWCDGSEWDQVQRGAFKEAVRKIKENTCQLAKRQIGKIMRLKGAGWDLQRVEATEAFREVMKLTAPSESAGNQYKNEKNNIKINDTNNNNNININIKIKNKRKKKKEKGWMEVWEREVVEPSVKIVKQFVAE